MKSEDVHSEDVRDRLTAWWRTLMPDATDVRVEGLDRVEFGHSAEMLVLTLAWQADGTGHRENLVVRLRPPAPGLLEPYDLERQFHILRAIEPTAVRAPRARWFEGTGEVLGRPFYVMERLEGEVYERSVPDELADAPARIRQMSESLVDELAAIHLVDLEATGISSLGDGHAYVDRELAHWTDEMQRVQRGPLPALERLAAELRDRQPESSPTVTLVHGDAKPGNFAFVGDNVSAVFDWEMATVGDPLADIGYLELMWGMRLGITSCPGCLTVDEFVARYQDRTGITVRHREWYRAFQGFKTAVILLLGAMLFDGGWSDDLRFVEMGAGVAWLTRSALRELGIDERLESGPVTVREERVQAVLEQAHSTS